ncbi:MAG TPA: diaminopimelate decarboxylase [Bryobacteraceae bacterium]|nr:diaminopimelate decarboxylase [Bryobacteraceae bacterium]
MEYRDHTLHIEGVALAEVAARVGTPCYVYSSNEILGNYRAYDESFGDVPHSVCYAVKANGNLAVLRLLAKAGAGFDIVSGGELFRVLKAGGDPKKVVFSGVGKTAAEIDQALDAGIFVFNCESEPELALIDALAHRRGVKARVAVRVNPDVDAATHAYISTGRLAHKFGIDIADAECVYERARQYKNLLIEGVSCHIGSQLMDPAPVMEAVDRVLTLIERLRAQGFDIRHVDLGGGLGIGYKPDDVTPRITRFAAELRARIAGRGLHAFVEPGRSIVGNAGILLTRVLYRKKTGEKDFVIVDGAMNDLIRPALYGAYHEIVPVRHSDRPKTRVDVVGPVCETGDFLARDREIADVFPGDLLAVCSAGAYGFAQSSNYNARPRAAEVLVEGDLWRIVRTRESFEDLVRNESGPDSV